ncbi:MAG: glycosyltransferase [Candidatus Peregrinibacteria bacterium]
MSSLSVVIPTFRRPNILRLCLKCLEAQTIADELEVIVVSDGPDPETAKVFQGPTSYQLQAISYLEISKSQQGAARNAGVKRATAPFTLFIGDDILLDRSACQRHLECHGERSRTMTQNFHPSPFDYAQGDMAVLGFTTWDPVVEITPVMHWLERSGWQFGYPKIAKYAHNFLPKRIQERFTYTSNISVPTDTARTFRFREDMTLYGWEDVEWGLRMKQAGIRLYYEPDAKALHHHHMTLQDSLRRAETLGQSLVELAHMNSAFRSNLAPWRLLSQRARSLLPTMAGKHRRAFLRGMKQANH